MRLSKNTRAEYDYFNAGTWDNPEGYIGRHRYEVSKATACADTKITPAQFDVLKKAISQTSEYPLAAFAIKANVLRNMVAAGLVEIHQQPWGQFQTITEVVLVTDQGRAAYQTVAEGRND
jgi:hypothetical protein